MGTTNYFRKQVLHSARAGALALGVLLMMLPVVTISSQVAVAENTGPICSGDAVRLNETGNFAVKWQWSSSGKALFDDPSLQSPTATGVKNGEVFTVLITDAQGNTASASTTVTVFSDPPSQPGQITGSETQCAGTEGRVYYIAEVPNATEYKWEVPGGVLITSGQGTVSIVVSVGSVALDGTMTVYAINACGISRARNKNLSVLPLPQAAGPIDGSAILTPGMTGLPYYVDPIEYATSYLWHYSGTGVSVNGTGNSVTLDFSQDATAGELSVRGVNNCGEGGASYLDLAPEIKTLSLSSLLLEGLYSGSGTMRQAWNETGPQWEAGVADHITVELHATGNYSEIVWYQTGVSLSISGSAQMNVPVVISGSYYVTVRHRNSIETTTVAPLSFSGSTVNLSFGTAASVFGGNLKLSGDGFFLVYGADVNQDGIVDTGDMNYVDNGSASIMKGYNAPDANGDGLVDTSDMNMVDNNSASRVIKRLPL